MNFRVPTGILKIQNLFLLCVFILSCNLLFAANSTPLPTQTPGTPAEIRRKYKMGEVDHKDTSWWKRTEAFLETGIGVALFFWVPHANVQYKADNVSVNVGNGK